MQKACLELGGGLPLFTENPRRRVFSETGLSAYGLLGNPEVSAYWAALNLPLKVLPLVLSTSYC